MSLPRRTDADRVQEFLDRHAGEAFLASEIAGAADVPTRRIYAALAKLERARTIKSGWQPMAGARRRAYWVPAPRAVARPRPERRTETERWARYPHA